MSGAGHHLQRYAIGGKALWRESPRWRRMAIAAGAGVGLWAVMALWSGVRHAPHIGMPSLPRSSPGVSPSMPAPTAAPTVMCNAACNEALGALETAHTAWSKDGSSGLNCERLVAAADQVGKLDPALRDPKKATLEDAGRCRAPLIESDRRLAALKEASRRVSAGNDAAAMAALVAAYSKLEPFDQTRELDSETAAALAGAEAAAKDVSQSDRRLAALLSAAAGSPDVPKSAEAMAAAISSITTFDRTRFDPALQAAATKAEAAAAILKESDERIQALKAAYERRKDDPEALVATVTVLTPFDRERLKAESALGVDLSAAENGVTDVLPKAFAASAEQFRQQQDRASAGRLVSLKASAAAHGIKIDPALEGFAAQAAQKIKDSDDALLQASRAADRWRTAHIVGDPPKEVADEVAAAYARLSTAGVCHPTAFDGDAMSGAQRRDFETLCLAVSALGQRSGSPLAAQRLTVYLAAPDVSKDAMLKSLLAATSDAFAGKGFQLVQDPGAAALTVSLSAPRFSRPGTGIDDKSGQPVVSGEVGLATLWSFARQGDDYGRIAADGIAVDAKSAFDLASKRLGATLAERVAAQN